MTRDDIIRMAREADMDVDHAESNAWGAIITAEPADLERFAALVSAAEREACAKLCEHLADAVSNENHIAIEQRQFCAKAIRARGMNDGLHK